MGTGCLVGAGGMGHLAFGILEEAVGPRRKLTAQREPGDSRGSLMQPFKKQ